MRWYTLLLLTALTLGSLALPARACPLCREAPANGSDVEEDDQYREAAAYNQSIYLMVSMPYLLLGVVGVAVYRRHTRQRVPADTLEQQSGGGPEPCPNPSPDEDS